MDATEAFGLAGIAAGMAVTTALVLAALLHSLDALVATLKGVAVAGLVCGGLAAVAFLVPSAMLAERGIAAASCPCRASISS